MVAQLDRAILVAGQTTAEVEATDRVVELIPSAEQVRFGSSGSELVHAALRLARAATGRRSIVKFEGHYHGWFDNVLWSVAPPVLADDVAPVAVPGSAGIPADAADDLVILRWNDADAVTEALATNEVAAVIMEPMMINSSGVLPRPGYLEAVREACTRTGTVLIFDEVITGFRAAPGGAQAVFGVDPDLTTLGKALANGFPVAALCGRHDLMAAFADRTVVHGGTYNTQAPGMAAVGAALGAIAQGDAFGRAERAGQRLQEGLRRLAHDRGIALRIEGFPTAFHVAFDDSRPWDYRSAVTAADRARYVALAEALLHRGVRILPRGTWFLSSEHDDALVDETLAAVAAAL